MSYRWFLFSEIAMAAISFMDLVTGLPLWLHRFSGFIDMPIMFGWLMIVMRTIYLKVDQNA